MKLLRTILAAGISPEAGAGSGGSPLGQKRRRPDQARSTRASSPRPTMRTRSPTRSAGVEDDLADPTAYAERVRGQFFPHQLHDDEVAGRAAANHRDSLTSQSARR